MTHSLTKQEKLVLTGLLVCCIGVASFITKFEMAAPQTAQVVENLIDYKMGKATEEISTYSLEGREIDRTVLKEEGFVAKAVRKISEALGLKKDIKKVTAAKKAEEAKKAKATTQAKKLPNREFAKPVQKASAQKPTAFAKKDTSLNNQNYNNGSGYVAPAATPNEATAQTEQTKKVKKSLEQIRTEFMTAPSRETMMTLVTSYKKGDVSSTDFYQLQSELLESQDDTLVGYALYGLRLTPSTESFSMMAQYQPTAKAAYQTYIEEALLSYNQSSQISILGSVIRSGDKVTVLKASQVVQSGISSIKNGTVSQLVDSRGRRETTHSNYSLQNYLTLLPFITQALAASQDNELSASLESLKNIITDIKDSNTQVASN